MRSRIFICLLFVFAFCLTSADSAKAQGEKATVGSQPIVKKPAAAPKKTAPVKAQSGSSSSKTSAAKKTPPKKKPSSRSKSAAKPSNKPKSDDDIVITFRDEIFSPDRGAGLGGESMKACRYYLGSGLYDKWQQTGGENGELGCPMMNETDAAPSPQGTTGRMTQFNKGDGGYIIWHGAGVHRGTSFMVGGCFFMLYKQIGGTGSYLGFPVSDAYGSGGVPRQDFEGGYMLWNPQTSVCTVYRN